MVKFTAQWEDGTFVAYPAEFETLAEAKALFRKVLARKRFVQFPGAFHGVVAVDGKVVFEQWGKVVTYNQPVAA